MSGAAYRSNLPEALAAWEDYQAHVKDVARRREEMGERYGGRHLWVNNSGFGHGTQVVGLEIRDDEKPGDLIGEHGELRIPLRGATNQARPNIRRKAGKELQAELQSLKLEGPNLPGMPGWTLLGLSVLKPAVVLYGDSMWVFWGESDPFGEDEHGPGGTVDMKIWTRVPLSTYYAAKEAEEMERERKEAKAS